MTQPTDPENLTNLKMSSWPRMDSKSYKEQYLCNNSRYNEKILNSIKLILNLLIAVIETSSLKNKGLGGGGFKF
jgi:hypothetical protein